MASFQNRAVGRSWQSVKASKIYCSFVVLLCMLPFVLPGRSGPLHADCWECENGLRTPIVGIKTQARERPDHITSDRLSFVPSKSPERRFLFYGLGSAPPQCNSKCGRCNPCSPIHVPIQPGLVKTTEYYPEAWRCKCGAQLYMP
ncbi:hypothetical protein O6H91_11G015100 [Diphasiastrum complanatum]|uniref:Uncharacterized protein n=1 Tax=Diphasiastrum complanatum TaxID=34168 RepID=A0ACC2C6T4_DIPCM|nr:hypothetical protein O6H91_11G015100 [Diphasiastrum complanatum]